MNWELSVLHWFESIHNPVLDVIMKCITVLGNSGIFWILLAVVLMFFKKYRKTAVSMAFALVLSLIFTNLIIKILVARERPFAVDPSLLQSLLIKKPTDWSFPSGHSSASFAAAVAVFCNDKRPGIPLVILAALIAVSRLYLTVHFPTDVIAGTVLGIIYGIGGYIIATKIYMIISSKKESSAQSDS